MAEPSEARGHALAMIAAATREDEHGTRVLADVMVGRAPRDVAYVLAWTLGAAVREIARLLDVPPGEAVEMLRASALGTAPEPGP